MKSKEKWSILRKVKNDFFWHIGDYWRVDSFYKTRKEARQAVSGFLTEFGDSYIYKIVKKKSKQYIGYTVKE